MPEQEARSALVSAIVATRFGTSPCQPGKRNDWPAATRFKDFEAPASVGRRGHAFTNDQKYTAPPCTGRRARDPP